MAKGADSAEDLINRLVLGAERACKQYLKLSGHPTPGVAPESFIQARAAKALSIFDKSWVVLEATVLETPKDAGQRQRGNPRKQRDLTAGTTSSFTGKVRDLVPQSR